MVLQRNAASIVAYALQRAGILRDSRGHSERAQKG
jgi:hypothetical protein